MMLKETPEGFMCCKAQHVSVTERVLTWSSPRVFLNVNKCFSCILNWVRSLNSPRRRKEKKREKETDWGRACMCPCARSLVQKHHCHYQSLSAALEQWCNKAARTWVSCALLPLTQTSSCTLPWQPQHDPHEQDTSHDAQLRPRMQQCHITSHAFLMNEYK